MNIDYIAEKQIIIVLKDIIKIKIIYDESDDEFIIWCMELNKYVINSWVLEGVYSEKNLIYERLKFIFIYKSEEINFFDKCLGLLFKFEIDDGLQYLQQ